MCVGNVSICQRVEDAAYWVYERGVELYERIAEIVSDCLAWIAEWFCCQEQDKCPHYDGWDDGFVRLENDLIQLRTDVEADVERFTNVDQLDEEMRQELALYKARLDTLLENASTTDFRDVAHFINNVESKEYCICFLPHNCLLYVPSENLKEYPDRVLNYDGMDCLGHMHILGAPRRKVFILKPLLYQGGSQRKLGVADLACEHFSERGIAQIIAEYSDGFTPKDCILAKVDTGLCPHIFNY